MSKHPKADLYLADRAKGMSYREIAEKYGVTYQSVHATCTSVSGEYKKLISRNGCIYPNLRAWLNQDRQRSDRFFQAMRGCCIREILKGSQMPKKNVIDKMLAITGMTYEEMFREVSDGNEY